MLGCTDKIHWNNEFCYLNAIGNHLKGKKKEKKAQWISGQMGRKSEVTMIQSRLWSSSPDSGITEGIAGALKNLGFRTCLSSCFWYIILKVIISFWMSAVTNCIFSLQSDECDK